MRLQAHPTPSEAVAEAPAGPAAQPREDRSLPCPGCGYDLRGSESDRCPECGEAFTRDELSGAARIPWQQRRLLGRWRALGSTVWMAMRHPKQLAQQMGRDVAYQDARQFHFTCCALGWLALAPLLAVGLLDARQFLMEEGSWLALLGSDAAPLSWTSVLLDGLVLATAMAGLLLWLITATGVMSYFFHPRDLDRRSQDNAIAISYYSAAPLSLLPAATLLLVLAIAVQTLQERTPILRIVVLPLLGAVVLIWALVLFDLLLIPWTLLRSGLRRPIRRPVLLCVIVLLAAPVLFVVWVIAPALLVLWLEAVIVTVAR